MLPFLLPFDRKQIAPTSDPRVGSLFSVRFNGDWLPFVLGALYPLWDRAMWAGDDQTVLDAQINASQILTIYPVTGATSMIGAIFPFIGANAPENCLKCDGAEYLRVDYPDLYALLPDSLIVDEDTFILPDLRGRTLRGGDTNWPIGNTGGEDTVQLEIGNLPAHTHTIAEHTHSFTPHHHGYNEPVEDEIQEGTGAVVPTSVPGAQITTDSGPLLDPTALETDETGGNDGHENWPPWYTATWCVVARL